MILANCKLQWMRFHQSKCINLKEKNWLPDFIGRLKQTTNREKKNCWKNMCLYLPLILVNENVWTLFCICIQLIIHWNTIMSTPSFVFRPLLQFRLCTFSSILFYVPIHYRVKCECVCVWAYGGWRPMDGIPFLKWCTLFNGQDMMSTP